MPEHIVKAFRELAGESGPGSVKHIGTAAVTLLLGMPPEVRDAVLSEVQYTAWRTPKELKPEQAWRALLKAIGAEAPGRLVEVDPKRLPTDLPPGTKFYVDRILDPEILGGPKPSGPIDTNKIPKGRKSG